jgi:hypothetical protein
MNDIILWLHDKLLYIELGTAIIVLALIIALYIRLMPDKHERSIRRYKKLLAEAEEIRQYLTTWRLE